MKRVVKSPDEPPVLAGYKRDNAHIPANLVWARYKKRPDRREPVKEQLRTDQRGLCAYCENLLIPQDESVEHFIGRDADHSKELDWSNLLLYCAGGERPLPEDVEDADVRYDAEGLRTCGHAKLGCQDNILHPLEIPHTPRLFRFKSETGEIQPDEAECHRAGIDPALASQTIGVLRLHAGRLNRARLSVMQSVEEELNKEGNTEPLSSERERELAETYLPATGAWPAFFTTLRFSLGDGAEAHLASLNFQG